MVESWSGANVLLGKLERKKVAHETYLIRDGSDIHLRQHSTNIVTYKADGTYVLRNGGWFTRTTRDWLNNFTPFRITGSLMTGHFGGRRTFRPGDKNWREWEVWVRLSHDEMECIPFEEGMEIYSFYNKGE